MLLISITYGDCVWQEERTLEETWTWHGANVNPGSPFFEFFNVGFVVYSARGISGTPPWQDLTGRYSATSRNRTSGIDPP